MSDGQIARYLRTEELYTRVMYLVAETEKEVTEGDVRGLLDAILSQGKIEGRLMALIETATYPTAGEMWRNRENDQDVVEIISVSPALIVHFLHAACKCRNEQHAKDGHPSASAVYQFTELYELAHRHDRLIEGWQRIVDSVE